MEQHSHLKEMNSKPFAMLLLNLPREVMLHILKHMSVFDLILRVKFTCKYLHGLCFEPSLFRSLDLTYKAVKGYEDFSKQTSNIIGHLQVVGEHVRSLSVGFYDLDGYVNFYEASKYMRYKDVYLCKIFSFIQGLKSLSIYGLNAMKQTTFEYILTKYPNLEKLAFSLLSDSREIPQVLLLSESPMNNLKVLSITIITQEDRGDENWNCDDKATAAFIGIIKNNPGLKTIDVTFDYFTSDEVIPILLSADYVKLNELHLSCPLYFPRLMPFVLGSGSLSSLSLDNSRVSDAVMERIAKGCPNLMEISVRGCCLVTDIGISHLGNYCHLLQRLVINEDMYGTRCNNVTSVGLQAISEGCSNLKSLIVNHCPEVSDIGVVNIAVNCPHLTEIQIAGCLLVADEGVTALASNCHSLQIVNLNLCLKVTDEPINKLVQQCPHLHTLMIESCHYISELNFDGLRKLETPFSLVVRNDFNYRKHTVDGDKIKNESNSEAVRFHKQLSDNVSNTSQNQEVSTDVDEYAHRPCLQECIDTPQSSGDLNNLALLRGHLEQVNKPGFNMEKGSKDKKIFETNDAHPLTYNVECSSVDKDLTSDVENRCEKRQNNESVPKMIENGSPEFPQYTVNTMASVFKESKLCNVEAHSHIRVLHLSFCSLLVDQSLRQISKHLPDLVEISLRSCYRVTDSAVRSLVQGCRRLRKLDLSGGSAIQATKLTDESLKAITDYGQGVEELIMLKNYVITCDGVKHLVASGQMLRYMCISGSSVKANITVENMKKVAKTISNRTVTVEHEKQVQDKGTVRINIFCR